MGKSGNNLAGVLVVLAVALAGCGAPSRTQIRQEVLEQDFPQAEKDLNKRYRQHREEFGAHDEDLGPGKHALLWNRERASVDVAQGEWLNALVHLKTASAQERDGRTVGAVRSAGSVLINDTLRNYFGEPFEHPYVPYYGMLANLMLAQELSGVWHPPMSPISDKDHAIAEPAPSFTAEDYADRAASAAAALEATQRATQAQEFGSYSYRDNAFLHLAAAVVRAATAASNDDRQAASLCAERAWKAYEAAGTIPELARMLVPLLVGAYDPARAAELTKLKDVPRLPPGQGVILVIEEIGFVPKLEKLQILAVTGAPPAGAYVDLGGVFIFVDGPDRDQIEQFHSILLPGELIRELTGGQLGVFGFQLPVLPRPAARANSGSVAGDAGFTAGLEIVDDVQAHARQCFDDHKARRIVTVLTRTAAKMIAARQAIGEISRHSPEVDVFKDLLWFGTSALLTATEQADTRCWTLLPDRIAAGAIIVPAGMHDLTLTRSDGKAVPLGQVNVAPGGWVIVTERSFPAGFNYAGPAE